MKASKGSVVVESFKDRLRLRWRVAGKRYCLSLGLPDTQESRMLAELKARQIELDAISGNFDATLTKYKPQSLTEKPVNEAQLLTCAELFQQFMEYKAQSLHPRSLDRYKTTLKYLHQFYYREGEKRKLIAEQNAIAILQTHAEQFNAWLQSKNAERARKERLILLSACWSWGMTKGFVEINPWRDLQRQVESAPKQSLKPFTQEEVKAILAAFKTHPQYRHYADFVEFLFLTGMRTTEAIALRWMHITSDMSSMWIGESISRGVPQTNKVRSIPLNDRIRLLLQARKPENSLLEDLIFPSPEGLPIDDRNFRNRAWVKMLELAGVEYRKPSNTRHTFICTCLSAGINPAVVAQITGCDLQSLNRDYAEYIPSVLMLPDVFGNW
ncbi:tyrosine-type recombinase/integrase [Scytonema millei]|uniref:Tyrosine-type recombinase/integrase n=1 Tax=Scytonema millei VB511283 TaxID=1245923 RepID=A0A9X5E6W0_9CYAN|nr:tyrosine-type recombinase/integrase [Scytonema millei]NHC36322.1 tyrosine-type recombinase/integrase [Scytonema millei VB511283]